MEKEEALKILRKDSLSNLVYRYSSEELQDAIDTIVSQPSLPSDLDEAAEKIASDIAPTHPDIDWDECFEKIKDGIKAGAEWMAGQGETHEAEIIESVPFGRTKWQRCIKVWLDDQFQAKGDKVIVQIRKK